MRIAAFSPLDAPASRRLGVVTGDEIHDVTGLVGPDLVTAIAAGLDEIAAFRGEPHPLDGVTLRAPIARPGKIVCVGLNYHDHCREQGVEPPAYPMLFAKFANAVSDPGATVVRPRATERLDLECELAVIIGRPTFAVSVGEAGASIFGYTVLNDITARDLQREDRQWLRAKGWDGFAPMGPVVVTAEELPDPGNLRVRSWVNDEPWQDSTTADMIWDVWTLIAFISRSITLEPGDVVATGTPAGVGHFHDPPRYLADGDRVTCEVEGIGRLEVLIADELPRAQDHATASGLVELAEAAGR
jgi:2-keto-4-pentenoate hydratase/2-oxohepta-3-ene-1,7-dioic acid hydratase in catechol pathway